MQALLIAALMVAAAPFGGQDTLEAAKQLYASAAYEDALAALDRLGPGDTPDGAREVNEYRAFCLYALGRADEAERVAELLIRRDPLIQLNKGEASPRIAAMFTSVRKRLLPGLIRDEFRLAKSTLGENKAAEAEPHFLQARELLAEAQRLGVWDDALADLLVLVDGFLDLSQARQTQVQSETASSGAIAQIDRRPPVQEVEQPRPAAQPEPAAAVPRVYTAADAQVTPPVAIRQVMPGFPPELIRILNAGQPRQGLLDVVIDERGMVQEAVMQSPVTPLYDDIMVTAARGWKYRPAMKDGGAVRYKKTIVIRIGLQK
jgi:tetratricopeptide (TPR) repeat protein